MGNNIKNRSSVLAIVAESTEGTAVAPTLATDFVALQAGFTMDPNTAEETSEEIRGTIGKTKPILGAEHPQAGMKHYLRHSGTEGTAPNYFQLIRAFFGAMTSNATQRSTTTSSTVSTIKLASGGSDFARGFAVLIKDSTYRIRPVLSKSSNDLALGFALPSGDAPGSGVGVGKCVNFSPDESVTRSFSYWLYRGNGGVIEMMAGGRVASWSTDIAAGKLIPMDFGIQGSAYYMNPLVITSSTCKLDFNDGSARTATLATGWYKDPNDLADAITTAMNAQGSSDTFTCVYNNSGSSAGKFTISTSGMTLSLKWNTGSNTANSIAPVLGFSTAADSTSATTYDSPTVINLAAPTTPTYDNSDPLVATSMELFLGDSTIDTGISKVQSVKISAQNTLADIEDVTSSTGLNGKVATVREIKIDIKATIEQYDVQRYKNYRSGDNVAFCLNFGKKSGGNWVPGKCGNYYAPSATLSKMNIDDVNGIATMNATLTCYVDSSGNGEFYLNFL